jgi:hypothetical protein
MTKLNETTKVRPKDLLAAAAAIAAGTQAYGEVVIFINPDEGEAGHFGWSMGDALDATTWLDITRPSTDQGGLVGPSSVGQIFHFFEIPYGYYSYEWNYTYGGASVATGPDGFTRAFDGGEIIDGAIGTFESLSNHAYVLWTYLYGYPFGYFDEGGPQYMAVRFSDANGYHYGWIGVVGRDLVGDGLLTFDAFAWGYETEPGVGINAGIPAPGTLAALAFGAVVTRRGRKRKGD